MIIRYIKIPTMIFLPITKLPKASITLPASALLRINLVEEIFKDSLNKVAIRSKEGNMENSRGSLTYIEIINIISDKDIFIVSSKSINKVGIGTIINNTIAITAIATTISPNLNNAVFLLLIL
jgi:hypothetical protein